ncbi:hypothetical protein HMPREF1868_01339 [Olsenella sp. DNF00959]|nr:hypothetical protein HMPREF1868_01339 [Olsenella sp. DNF00959]
MPAPPCLRPRGRGFPSCILGLWEARAQEEGGRPEGRPPSRSTMWV